MIRTVYNCFSKLLYGRTLLSAKFCEGHPSTSVVISNVEFVRDMIERDQDVTYQAPLIIDMKSIHTSLYGYLNLLKLSSRWTPHNMTVTQKQARVNWCKDI